MARLLNFSAHVLHFIILFSRQELVLRRDSFQATPCFWPVTLADCISLITSLCWASSIGSQHDATRSCCWARAAGLPAETRALSSKPTGRRCYCQSTGQTDGRMDTRPLHRHCCAYYARSVINIFRKSCLRQRQCVFRWDNFSRFQSAYRSGHSTETAWLQMSAGASGGQAAAAGDKRCMVLLDVDLSAVRSSHCESSCAKSRQ